MKIIKSLLFALAMVVALASCSRKTLISSDVKTFTKTVYTDTLVTVKVAVPIKSIELDTTLLNGTVVKEEGGMKITVTKKGDKIHVKAETLPDSVKADVIVKNKETTTVTEIKEVYEKQDTLFKRIMKGIGTHLVLVILALVAIAVVVLKLKKNLL